MTVTEVHQSLGSWELRLREDTPKHIRDALTYFGHIAVMPGKFDPTQYGDNLLPQARFVGVFRGRDFRDELTMRGSGLAYWLGDEEDKGDIHETAVVLNGATFAESVNALLPPAGGVAPGNILAVAGTYTGKHQWQTARKAITYVTDTFGAEWRIRGDALQKVVLDAGTVSQLFVTTPTALILAKDYGQDMFRAALPGRAQLGTDVEDLTTRVVLLAEGEGDSISTGDADAPLPIYKNLRGQPIKLTRLVSESQTDTTNAQARAQLQLNRFTGLRKSVNLSTFDYDVKGQFVVGDYVDVYDPQNGFEDVAREIYWRGSPINPVALRCVEMTWPIEAGWTVGFRDINGVWVDLSPWYEPEGGETQIVVGALSRSLTQIGGEPVGIRPNLPDTPGTEDTTIPAAPVFGTFTTGSYQPDNGEWTKAAVFVEWTQPLNTDGSVITDGGHYEIRYRINNYIGYKVRWGQLNVYRWGELAGNRWGAPITDPVPTSQEWTTVYVGWGQTNTLIQELTPGVEYEFQIRAVDAANPPKQGPWSASEFVVASEDLFAPDVPAAPVVAASRLAIQVIHMLGRASGGTYNLQPDLVYLSVHVGGSDSFYPDGSNEVGKLMANSGMIQANIPAVGTFQIEQTDDVWVRVVAVDRAGNKSGPSEAVQASVDLIDDQHISDLTVTKVTAGTIMAEWIMAGAIRTAQSGARVEMTGAGIQSYNAAGQKTVDIKSSDGSVSVVGQLKTDIDGKGITINPGSVPDMILRPNATDNNEARMFSFFFQDSVAVQLGVEDAASNSMDGGKFLAFKTGTVLSHQPDFSGGVERYIGLNWPTANAMTFQNPGTGDMYFYNDTGTFWFRGKFSNATFADPNQAIVTIGDTTAGTGPILTAYSYGPTMARTLWPIVTAKASADTFVRVSAQSNTGFTVGLSAAVAHGLNAWCIAM